MSRDWLEGFVLAGGGSTRFGSNKALASFGGRPLIAHALRALRGLDLVPRVVTRDPDPLREHALAFVTGERVGEGPAEALRAALAASARPWALVLGTDMPGVDAPLLRDLLRAAGEPPPADGPRAFCFGTEDGRRHPLPGLYHRSLAADIVKLGPGPALMAVLDAAGARTVLVGTEQKRSRLRSANRPEDLETS
jgi:molybdopterin-guanine dinucleotide biosynthesis protein A